MWSACGGGEEPPQHLIDIPPSYDPQCERLIRPRPRAEGSLRCVVRLQPREKDVLMHVEDGNVLLLVARKEGKHWRIGERDSPASPSSRLRPTLPPPVSAAGADRAFASASALVQLTTCGGGAYSVERVNTMAALLPLDESAEARDGSGREWLPGEAEPPGELRSQLHDALVGQPTPGATLLMTKLPRWNPSTDAFELPFHGRANLASERNFQLVTALRGKVAADAPIVLLHGKLDEATYSLDFRYPLSPLHAFALALVTWGW
ncbi:hypothetical protein EMIHUDRAFT_219406 [Emiliania huxleyi CCMP1516]|uniref:Tubby C-terminal domain-containing protein n=2 Tax=Emiliania huxleyi TaxID=2903 RepID=A0A0D3I4B7_EMIH1|nr:hypothetical protein EMIHUDRAFT_219406 [Emiliania huxleyi CCMP1516]EOD06102.1 hypothetical protein EMIHUDRAFT_219406 [Emiliania huxleyi CCMP1516]|eukprot:XP_005758531.1 hypothetical protein EMIHUDRAFT_219406 [Emiliania huxleyi CCMP1516]